MRDPPVPEDRSDRRAQSEVISYVLAFTIILVAFTVVIAFGFSALEQTQENVAANNGEVAMQSVSADIGSLYRGSAVTRDTELTLGSGSLETGPETEIVVDVPSRGVTRSVTLYPIVYATDGADIVYEGTLLLRDQPEGQVAVNDPAFVVTDERTVVPLVETYPLTGPATASGGTVEISARVNSTEGTTLSVGGNDVVVTVRSVPDHVAVWESVLAPRVSDGCTESADGTELVCTHETEELVVSKTNVTYEFR